MDDMAAPKNKAKSKQLPCVINPLLLYVSGWDIQSRCYSKMFFLISGRSYLTDVLKRVHVSDDFGFNQLFVETSWTDLWDWLTWLVEPAFRGGTYSPTALSLHDVTNTRRRRLYPNNLSSFLEEAETRCPSFKSLLSVDEDEWTFAATGRKVKTFNIKTFAL